MLRDLVWSTAVAMMAISLWGCGASGSTNESRSGSGSLLTPAGDLPAVEETTDYEVVATKASALAEQLNNDKIVTSEISKFLDTTLASPDFRTQILAMPVIKAALKVDPSSHNSMKSRIKRQIDLAFSDEKAYWQATLYELFPETKPKAP